MWTSIEDAYATAIAKRTGGAHFIVNTADNGRGPLHNQHPSTEGVEDLCNPPNRGLGIRDTTDTGLRYGDAYMWTHPPGDSSGCGGGPPGNTFWPERAETEAAHADDQLGPGLRSRPYSRALGFQRSARSRRTRHTRTASTGGVPLPCPGSSRHLMPHRT